MINGVDLPLMFLTGLFFGASHCVGMCGGFVTAYTLGRTGGNRPACASGAIGAIPSHLAYNLGRITTYTLIGAFMGWVGSIVQGAGRLVGIQGVATSIAGLLMLAWAVSKWRGNTLFEAGKLSLFRLGWFQRVYRVLTREKGVTGTLLLGLLLGFLPCGLLTTMEIKAAGTGSIAGGMLVMLAFGLGTAPPMIAFGTISAWLGAHLRDQLDRAAAVAVGLAGLLSVLRGLAENGIVPHAPIPWLF